MISFNPSEVKTLLEKQPKTTSMFEYKFNPEVEPNYKLPKQARLIVDLMPPKVPIKEADVIKLLQAAKDTGRFNTKQDVKRIFKYYRNQLLDSKLMSVVFGLPPIGLSVSDVFGRTE